jgi:hypothetical protein
MCINRYLADCRGSVDFGAEAGTRKVGRGYETALGTGHAGLTLREFAPP